MSMNQVNLEMMLGKSILTGEHQKVRLFTMNDQLGQVLNIRASYQLETKSATGFITEHDCWMSSKTSPSESEREAVQKVSMLLDNYLKFCYGEFYRLEIPEDET